MTPPSVEDQDRADMARLTAGRETALNDLMQRHGGRLFHYLMRAVQNEDEAADLAQEAFVRVYQNRARFDSRQKFSTWLYAIASNLAKDCYRHRSRHPQVSLNAASEDTGVELGDHLTDPTATPSESLQASERAETVRRAVAALPDELRAPLILAEYEELSQAEIGEILGCSVKAVETRIHRARKQLRERLGALVQQT
jgi:RNA polymerase sigma-70 factor (ECF subfamily)